MQTVPIPQRMAHLKIDRRGYPIPHGVLIDAAGEPHFAINNEATRWQVVSEDCCSICGTRNVKARWFVGGSLSAFHEDGAFIDPPMHGECAKYALQVCPYLAAPRYAREIGLAKAKAKGTFDPKMILIDNTMIPGRPAGDLFVAIKATRQQVFQNFNMKPLHPFAEVQFWRHGQRLPDAEGLAIMKREYGNANVDA
jgi:hypothetical protein